MQPRRLAALLAAATLLTLAGCSDDEPTTDDGTTAPSSAPASTGAPSPSATATPRNATFPTYVALGDSYTAAPGVPTTDTSTGCLRSDGNYPALVAQQLGTELVDVSCSGASTLSLIGVQESGGTPLPPQFQALTPETSLVTLGIGGNDLELFRTLIATCAQLGQRTPEGAPCQEQMADAGEQGGDLLEEKVDQIGARVAAALAGIHDRAPEAKVVLVGYPQPVPAEGRCDQLPLAAGDYPYVRSLVTDLGAALKQAAATSDATYVDLLGPSEGHDICAGQDAWVNGITTDTERALAFHPFAAEQQAVADLVVAGLS